MEKFSPEASFKMGYYVYALIDPRIPKGDPGKYFYIGKGKGQRCFQHASAEIKWKKGEPDPKLSLIKAIRQQTKNAPPIEIIVHGCGDDEVKRVEAILIKILKTKGKGNAVEGHYTDKYVLPIESIEALYANPLDETDLNARVLLVSLNGGKDLPPFGNIPTESFNDRVLGKWPVSESKAGEVQYVVGVYQKLVKCVFKVKYIDGMTYKRVTEGKQKNGHPNWKVIFNGDRSSAKESLWCNRRIIDSKGKDLTAFDRQKGTRIIGSL
ncbi:MAG: hypothetical protein HQL22_08415 [Candidatus Omnitrophica bacterium]|nr:hypothetical protein [Candidatus Omnitrophota bacterium]